MIKRRSRLTVSRSHGRTYTMPPRQSPLRTLKILLVLLPSATPAHATTLCAKNKPPVVIAPGFGNADTDYTQPFGATTGFVHSLTQRGIPYVAVLKLPRYEWVRVAAGLLDPHFYTNRQKPMGIAYGWYLRRLQQTVDDAYQASNGQRVLICAHSAGGWLARAALADDAWLASGGAGRVCGLVTLGAPHYPPPDGLAPCATRGALAYCEQALPGAHVDGIEYVTVAGAAIAGAKPTAGEAAEQTAAQRAAAIAYNNYRALSGDGCAVGDGVIPVETAHLPGAMQLTLENVVHSINEAGSAAPTERWYGSERVIDAWLPQVLECVGTAAARSSSDRG